MEAKNFANGYPRREVNPSDREDNETFIKAEAYSEFFGTILHDALTGEKPEGVDVQSFAGIYREYNHFVYNAMKDYERRLFESGKDYGYKRISHLGFHWLNVAMVEMWHLLIAPDLMTDEKFRLKKIEITQDMLAFGGSQQFTYKDRLAAKEKDYAYFDSNMDKTREVLEGSLHERDAAIVLLDIAKKHPGMVVLPSPAQFERWAGNTETGNRNADFVVVDVPNQRAVGVQVKSFVSGNSTDGQSEYDPDFVVMIDGYMDLENRQKRRTQHTSTRLKGVSWAGMISADHVKKMSVHGPHATMLIDVYGKPAVMRHQFDAKTRLGTTKVNRQQLAQNIEPRILAKL
jgi:predicted regulator of Ras-like GTPase activity (Roadblock/LC7/MglB family)